MPKKKRAARAATRPHIAAAPAAAAAPTAAAAPAADTTFEWSPNNRACTATWMALRMLDQSVRPFRSSGAVRMRQLTYFNAAASDDMRRFLAGTLAKQLDNFFRQIDGARFEDGTDPVAALSDLTEAVLAAEQSMADLAMVVDHDYRFWEEDQA
jgi:hypothetical protein